MKWVSIFLVSSACILSSCNSEKDIYDPNYNSKLNVTIPEGFEWSTTQKVTVNVEVNDEYDGKYYYAVRVYDKAPAEGVLPVAASGEVTGDMPFSQDVVIPATVSKLYIAQVFKNANASEVVTMKEVAINGPVIDCSFGASSKSRSIVSSRGDDNKIKVEDPNDIESNSGKEYLIERNTQIKIKMSSNSPSLEGVKIDIKGTLTIDGSVDLKQWDIDVENGGSFIVNGDLVLDGNKNGSSLENSGYVYVKGDLHVKAGASLENDDNESDDDEEIQLPGGCIVVDGEAHFQSNEIELDERSYMSCGSLKLNGSDMKITMETGAWLRVIGELTSSKNCEIGYGDDGKFKKPKSDDYILGTEYVGLLQVGSWGNNGNGNLTTRGEVLVECPTGNGKYNITSFTEDATGKITIAGTSCSGSFGDEEKTGTPLCTYALEDVDINEGDYDMNDIVVAVTSTIYSPAKKTWTIKGEVLAAGATNALVPYFQYGKDGEKTYLFENKGNVYEAFGLTGSPVPVNTIIDGTKADNIIFEIVLPNIEAVSPQLSMLNFGIEVNGQEETISWLENGTGANARAIQIAALFKYPIEKKRITEAYPDFNKWISTAKEEGKAWYDNPNDNYVITPQLSTKTN